MRGWGRVWVCVLLGAGCGHESPGRDWVARTETAHRRADEALARGDFTAGREALAGLLATPPPAGVSAEDRRLIEQDALFRLALLEIGAGRADVALGWADQGLRIGRHDDLFSANLLVARGRAHEALGQDAVAAEDYHAALVINEGLLGQVLGRPRGLEEAR